MFEVKKPDFKLPLADRIPDDEDDKPTFLVANKDLGRVGGRTKSIVSQGSMRP
jgi:hypothetical protein